VREKKVKDGDVTVRRGGVPVQVGRTLSAAAAGGGVRGTLHRGVRVVVLCVWREACVCAFRVGRAKEVTSSGAYRGR
jgi:hypothetical protein